MTIIGVYREVWRLILEWEAVCHGMAMELILFSAGRVDGDSR